MVRASGGSNTPHCIRININICDNSGRKWKDLQQDDDGRETVENW